MAVELINIGNIANDGTGDELRVAFRKINQNFEDVDIRLGDAVEGINTGSGVGVFRGRTGNDLQFKSLTEGTNVTITSNNDNIAISVEDVLTETLVQTDAGSFTLTNNDTLKVYGGEDISTELNTNDNSIVINSTKVTTLAEDPSPLLTTDLNANLQNITNVDTISANDFIGGSITGTFSGVFNGVDTDDLVAFFSDFDFGSISTNITTLYEFLLLTADVNLGGITSPSAANVDFGTLL